MKARLLHHGCYSILPHRAPITSLVTLPLRGLHKDGLHGLLVLLGELASELGKGLLVMGHADRQALKSESLEDRPTECALTNTQWPALPPMRSTSRIPLFCMLPSTLERRYLPRPIGQRACTSLRSLTYSSTSQLILLTGLATLTCLEEKMRGILPAPAPTPSSLPTLT